MMNGALLPCIRPACKPCPRPWKPCFPPWSSRPQVGLTAGVLTMFRVL